MAKKRERRRDQPKGPTKKHRARSLREQQQRRKVLMGLAVVGLLVVLVLGAGVVQEFVLKPQAPVAKVGQQTVSLSAYQHRVQYNRYQLRGYISQLSAQLQQIDPNDKSASFIRQYYQNKLQQLQARYVSLASQVLDDMIDDLLVEQRAAAEGIAVSEAEVDEAIRRQMAQQAGSLLAVDATATATAGVAASATAALWTPTPIPTPTPTLTATNEVSVTSPTPPASLGPPPPTPTTHLYTEEEFQKNYQMFINNLKSGPGVTEAEYREMVRASLFRQKLQEFLAQQVPTEAEQVHARHILVKTKEEAEKVLKRLKNGEDFATVAKEVSQDPGSKDKGGDLGWFPRGQMVNQFEDVAFSLNPGQLSDPVQTSFGYHIIEVLEGPETRPLGPAALQRRQQSALSDWLEEARFGPDVERNWTPDKAPPDPFGTPVGG
jgi:parvulin-like peptidyl-prolyl isomerase